MADSIDPSTSCAKATPSYRHIFDNFSLDNPPVFVFLRIGPLCNASGSFAFTKACCDVDGITKSLAPGLRERYLAVDMDDLFARGFQVLKSEEESKLTEEEKTALNDLQNFLLNIDVHQRNLVNAIEKMKVEQSKKTILSMAVGEHLFSNLASGYTYGIDSWAQGKGPNKVCKCGCNKPANFIATGIDSIVWKDHSYTTLHKEDVEMRNAEVQTDLTVQDISIMECDQGLVTPLVERLTKSDESVKKNFGVPTINMLFGLFGHHKVWHGFVDIMLSEKKEKNPIGTVIVTDTNLLVDEKDDDEPTTAKRARLADDVSLTIQSGDSISEVKLKIKGVSDQTFAQTIVFALAQKRLHPDIKTFIPNILITEKQFYIIMYDPSNDILVRSQKISLWSLESSSCLQEEAVIKLWMALHYKLFCSGSELFTDACKDEIKAQFMEHVLEDRKKFYKELDIGVINFETEEKDELSRDLTTHSFYKFLKKQKSF